MGAIETTLELKRGQMGCIRFGCGSRPMLLIAGMSLAGLGGLGDAIAQQYAILHADYTVYTFDRLTYLPEDYTVRDMAEDIAEAMDLLGIESAYVMGTSQGGMIAMTLAASHPEKVRALLPASSCAKQNAVGLSTFAEWIRLAEECDGAGIYRDFFNRVFTHPNDELLKLLENTGTDEQCRRFRILAKACLDFDITDRLSEIKCPVLILGARGDKVFGGEASETLAKLLNCECHIFEGYGHAVYDEAPDFLPRVKAFFDSIG